MADFDARSFRRFSTLRPVNEKRIDVIAARRMIPGEVLKYRSGLRWVIPRGQATTLTGSGGLCPTAPLTKLARQSANSTTYLATNHSSLNNLDARVEIKEWIIPRDAGQFTVNLHENPLGYASIPCRAVPSSRCQRHLLHRMPSTRRLRISDANSGPNRCHQDRTVSWLMSMPRSCSKSSTFRSDNGSRMYNPPPGE